MKCELQLCHQRHTLPCLATVRGGYLVAYVSVAGITVEEGLYGLQEETIFHLGKGHLLISHSHLDKKTVPYLTVTGK